MQIECGRFGNNNGYCCDNLRRQIFLHGHLNNLLTSFVMKKPILCETSVKSQNVYCKMK